MKQLDIRKWQHHQIEQRKAWSNIFFILFYLVAIDFLGELIQFQERQLCQKWFYSLLKRIYYNRKEFFPLSANSFLLDGAPFQTGLGLHGLKQEVKVISLLKMSEMFPSASRSH